MEEKTYLEQDSLEFKNFRFNLAQKLRNIGLELSKEELLQRYKTVNNQLIRNKVKEAGEKEDKRVIQIIETLDFIKPTISKFSNRLKEWYGLHFPEITDKFIEEEVLLAKLVFEIGHRKNYTREKLSSRFSFDNREEQLLLELATKSMGANIDLEMVKRFAEEILSLDTYRETLETHLDDLMDNLAPNIKAIVGSLVGAKLIAEAGSLRKLAFMPSSRIQLLGAEKALYRHLRTGSKLPKHGLIFQWKQIRGNPPWIRGNIARLIAGKVGLAAKIDYFSGDFIGDEYAKEIEEKIEKLKKEHPNPPKNN
jgi:nucleolar protein 56